MMKEDDGSAPENHNIDVSTAYGYGHILDIRVDVNESDNCLAVYEVQLPFGKLYAANSGAARLKLLPSPGGYDNEADNASHMRSKGSVARTAYGDGKVLGYRANDEMYSIKISFGILYAVEESLIQRTHGSSHTSTMELNVAYEALETMRKLNLELTCNELGVQFDPTKCTHCLLHQAIRKKRPQKGTPCFICASPCCKSHSCPKFRKEGNTVCEECKHLYSLDYVLDVLTAKSDAERSVLLTRMFDTYDRTLLMLKYSSAFMEDIANQLDKNKSWKNKVGIGSSGAGMVSGSLGIAATACLFTPAAAIAAPSLVIASICFGGTSSAMQTGVEMGTQYSEPNRVASRVIAWYGMQMSVLRTVSVLRDVMMRCYHPQKGMQIDDFSTIHQAAKPGTSSSGTATTTTDVVAVANIDESGRAAAKANMFITRGGANTVSMSSNAVSAGGNAVSASAMTAAQFASFAGGALSAAVLLCEGYQMSQAIQEMWKGNKCPKAELLRKIKAELELVPDTSELERECNNYMDTISRECSQTMSMEEAHRLLTDLLGTEAPVPAASFSKKKGGVALTKEEVDSDSETTFNTANILEEDEETEMASVVSDGSSSFFSFIKMSKSTLSLASCNDDSEHKNDGINEEDDMKHVTDADALAKKPASKSRGFWRGWSKNSGVDDNPASTDPAYESPIQF